jgi:hypothetical protein
LAESPIQANLIYAGTDDGIIQVTENGGQNWRRIDFSKIQGLPKTAFVNDIKADLFDENTVYAVFDNHKYGDFKPYVFKSTDKGLTWKNIAANLPDRTLLWRIIQDPTAKNLFFLGTEFGVFFSMDGCGSWIQLKGGLPNIAVRDLVIQKRENDLILATFGRGFYILDDYSALRKISNESLEKEAVLFIPRKTWWYKQKDVLGGGQKAFQGDGYYVAENPPFGVQFTYFLKDSYSTLASNRQKSEKELEKENKTPGVPSWDLLDSEKREIKPMVWMFITNPSGEVIRKIEATNSKGLQRVTWDFSAESPNRIGPDNLNKNASGSWVMPGIYQAQMFKQINGKFSPITEKIEFEVAPLKKENVDATNLNEVVLFWSKTQKMSAKAQMLSEDVKSAQRKIDILIKAYQYAKQLDENLERELLAKREQLLRIEEKIGGSKSRSEVGEKNDFPTLWNYLYAAIWGTGNSTYGPTPTHQKSLNYAEKIWSDLALELTSSIADYESLKSRLLMLGAPEIRD